MIIRFFLPIVPSSFNLWLPSAAASVLYLSLLLFFFVLSVLLFLQVDFEVTIPGEGKDRIFKVSIRWLAKVSWRLLQETLVSGRLQVPLDSVQALDVAMRHLASMRYRKTFFSLKSSSTDTDKRPYKMSA